MNFKWIFSFCFVFLFLCFDSFAKPVLFANQRDAFLSEMRSQNSIEDFAKNVSEAKSNVKPNTALSSEWHLYLGIIFFEEGDLKRALRHIDAIKSFRAKKSESLKEVALYYKVFLDAALSLEKNHVQKLDRLVQAFPKSDPEIALLESFVLAQKNHLSDAIHKINLLIGRDKKNGKAYLQRGVFQLMALSNSLALSDFEKAIRFLPKTDLYRLQQAYFQAGLLQWKFAFDLKKAKKHYEKAVALNPNSDLVMQMSHILQRF